jgi:hypothetical protein
MYTHFHETPEIRARNNRKDIATVFFVVRSMRIPRKRVAKHIPAEKKHAEQ